MIVVGLTYGGVFLFFGDGLETLLGNVSDPNALVDERTQLETHARDYTGEIVLANQTGDPLPDGAPEEARQIDRYAGEVYYREPYIGAPEQTSRVVVPVILTNRRQATLSFTYEEGELTEVVLTETRTISDD